MPARGRWHGLDVPLRQRAHVDFKSRHVRTENFMLERSARRSLFVSSFPSMKTINMAEYGYEDDGRHPRSDLSAVEKPRG